MDADFSQMSTFQYCSAFIPQMNTFQTYSQIQKIIFLMAN